MTHPRSDAKPIGRGGGSFVIPCIAALAFATFGSPANAQVCGNGVREAGEQCDDGNRASFDGCSANCRFEQSQRINQLALKSATSATCPSNILGAQAFTATTLSSFNATLASSIADGTTSLLLYFAHGLDDPTGAGMQPSLQIGVFNGTPLPGSGYDGTNDVDWWYAIDDSELGPGQVSATTLAGGISADVLSAGPSSFVLQTVIGGAPAPWHLSGAMLATPLGTSSTPMTNSPGTARGHLASENLDPALQSFATSGTGSPSTGSLCGNVSAASLAQQAVPPSMLSGGSTACTEGYTVTNSFLDVVVGGCTFSVIKLVNPKQPDQTDPDAAPAGSGGPYKLISGAGHVVTACQDSTKSTVDLPTCLNAAAYSVAFVFSTDRLIVDSSAAQDVVFHDDFDFFP